MEKNNVMGVDISYCQSGLNYRKLKNEGNDFALIRVGFTGTQSHTQVKDKLLERHVNGCKEAGIDYGFYWFSCAVSVEEARREAVACAEYIKKFDKPTYPVFFDMEVDQISNTGKTTATDIALAFVSKMEMLGYPSGIYVNPNWLEKRLDKSRLINHVDIWLAHWTAHCNCSYGQKIWQNGIKYSAGLNIDADICYVDYPKITADWYEKRTGKKQPSKVKGIDQIVDEVMVGKWGNGEERKNRLTAAGYDYNAIQNRVNEKFYGKGKTVDDIATEVWLGYWGVGAERKKRLEAAGYDYNAVQKRINEKYYR